MGPGGEQDLEVGVHQREKHAGEVERVKGLPLVCQHGVLEDVLPQAEHRLVEEAQ